MSASSPLSINRLVEFDGPAGTTTRRLLHIDDAAREVALFDVGARDALPMWLGFDELERDILDERVRP